MRSNSLLLLIAAGALMALPATTAANGQGGVKRCERTPMVGHVVQGTLVELTADSVTVTVTEANGHATRSGVTTGATHTVSGDEFKTVLESFENTDTPSLGDAVTIIGKVPHTKAKCALEGTSDADRYGAVDVRKVVVTDMDADV